MAAYRQSLMMGDLLFGPSPVTTSCCLIFLAVLKLVYA
jgi:hypothetical protein